MPYAAEKPFSWTYFKNWIIFTGNARTCRKIQKYSFRHWQKSPSFWLCFVFCKAKRRNTKGKKKVQMRKSFHFASGAEYDDFAASDFCFRIYLLRLLFKKKKHAATGPSHAHFFIYFQKSSFFSYPGFRCMCVCCTHASHSPTRVKVNNPSIFLDEKPSWFFLKHLTALMADRSFSLLVLHTRFKCLCVITGNQV